MPLPRKYSWPAGHWNWPINLSHKHGVRCGQLIFTGGQVDLDQQGVVQNPGNIDAQCEAAMAFLETILIDLGSDLDDLVKLVVYFIGDAETEARMLSNIATFLGDDVQPVVNTVGLPQLCYPDLMIEIEGVAMRGEDGQRLIRQTVRLDAAAALPQGFSHVLKCEKMIFTGDVCALSSSGAVEAVGDLPAQTQIMMSRLRETLLAVGAELDDVLKLNVFYVGGGTAEDWEVPANIRASYFHKPGPAPTGMPVERFPDPDMLTKIAVTAMRESDATPCSQTYAWPKGHWDWTAALPYMHGNKCGSMIHVGGQVSLNQSAEVVAPGDIVAQTKNAMKNVEAVLAELGAKLDDVVKVTTFYVGKASADELHENLCIRSNAYNDPGPATTGIPMATLVYEHMMIEIEVIAMLEAD